MCAHARPGTIGPAVIDEVAAHHPGDRVALDVERQGVPIVIPIKLGERNLPIEEPTSASPTDQTALQTM